MPTLVVRLVAIAAVVLAAFAFVAAIFSGFAAPAWVPLLALLLVAILAAI